MAANSSAGGPVGAPPAQAQNLLAQQPQTVIASDAPTRLNTYIYDHLLKAGQFDIARQFLAVNKCFTKPTKSKPNGIMDDPSDGPKRPDDLPEPDVESMSTESSFLLGWWCMFWDVFAAARKMPTARPGTIDYVQLQRARYGGLNQQRMPGQMNMPANGVFGNKMGSRNPTPNMAQMQQAKIMGQQMQRDPSGMDMAQRPQTPMENAPSPSKRPRLDSAGSFDAQTMAARQAAAAQAAGQMPNMMGAAAGQMAMQNGLAQPQMQHFAQNGHPKMENMGILQNSERMDGMEYNANSQGQPPTDNRHALQDYQMQLMMLEQQNKKRLLQARRDNSTDGMNPTGTPGNQMYAAPNMSPSTSRGGGPSPNANEVKRGTPKAAQQALPGSPMSELQNRSSPAPSFDPSGGPIPPGLQQQYYANMAGNARPPSSHPTFQITPGITQAQMEQMQRAGRNPNGMQWPQGGQQVMQANQAQAALRTGNMGPPPAPATEAPAPQQRTQPSSPAQQPAPPTPSQANKAAPKKKETATKKKSAPKKGATASTPAETEPPTPTTSTPMPSATFAKAATPTQAAAPVTIQQPQPQPLASAASMPSGLDPGAGPPSFDDAHFNLDFADINSNEVFESVDFDSFLHSNDDGNVFNLDNMPTFDGVEAGTSQI